MHKKGFTLLELLMTAAIISALAVIAVSSYRAKIGDTYIEDAKNQARALATAARLFELEYSVTVKTAEMPDAPFTIIPCAPTDPSDAQQLVACGFLENRVWGNDFAYLSIKDDRVCVNGWNQPKIPSKYRNKEEIFCVSKITGEEAE